MHRAIADWSASQARARAAVGLPSTATEEELKAAQAVQQAADAEKKKQAQAEADKKRAEAAKRAKAEAEERAKKLAERKAEAEGLKKQGLAQISEAKMDDFTNVDDYNQAVATLEQSLRLEPDDREASAALDEAKKQAKLKAAAVANRLAVLERRDQKRLASNTWFFRRNGIYTGNATE